MNKNFQIFFDRAAGALGIRSLSELAAILNVNRSSITQARKKNSVPANWLLELFRSHGLNPDWLEGGSGPQWLKSGDAFKNDFFPVPKVRARLCAGAGSFETEARIEDYYSFQTQWLQNKGVKDRMVLMDVSGNSMAPEIKDGDTVLIDQSQTDIFAGMVYAVGVEDTIMVKRLEKHPRKLVLLSDNKAYTPIFLADDEMDRVRIIGKVLWICRELR
ncbi:transcriptional regulator [Desulfosarcina alkanivorans]|jgi:phage repressor protein C with HTH and peptisase S24 domain|uniref:Transcriptional regulator n=1 Tax=Desulfosarcina alkanivorans TaxID=571177 RepID=A0A5K7YQ48_9BACT|nr:helix-turn-helix transcriptional regulator [Desulfosarcina alkanivorans]BBO70009.1 transcriptional regulator [Desulfosarcina alkanivorans]